MGGGNMSRIGFSTIEIPENVEVTVDGNTVTVKGPKGELQRNIDETMEVVIEDNVLTVKRPNDAKESRALHGTTRSLIQNMIEGVSEGYVSFHVKHGFLLRHLVV